MIEKTLAKEVTLLLKWFKDNSLEANPTKFQALLCQSNHSGDVKMNVIIEDVSVSSTPSITSLGVIIDSHLKFSEHISLLCQKASQQVNAMQRMYRLLDQRSRLVTYNSFIKSNFNYCPVVWMFANKTDLKKLEGIQIRALRFVYRDFTSSKEEILENCKESSVRIMNLRALAVEIFKCVNGLNPEYMNEMIEKKSVKYGLRKPNILVQPRANTTTYGIRSFRYYGPKLWNMLPDHLKVTTDILEFKALLKLWSGPTCQCPACLSFTT